MRARRASTHRRRGVLVVAALLSAAPSRFAGAQEFTTVAAARCSLRVVFGTLRAGKMPDVVGCNAAIVAGAFREAKVPLAVVPAGGETRFVVTPAAGQSVPAAPVMRQSPTAGAPWGGMSTIDGEGVAVQVPTKKAAPPIIWLSPATVPTQTPTVVPTETPSAIATQVPVPRIVLSASSDVTEVNEGHTIKFTFVRGGEMRRPIALTYTISDPARCAAAAPSSREFVLRPNATVRTIPYRPCRDDPPEGSRQVTFQISPVDGATLDQAAVAVTVDHGGPPEPPVPPGDGWGRFWRQMGLALVAVPGWLWLATGVGVAATLWRLFRRPPVVPPIHADCALGVGAPGIDPSGAAAGASFSLRVDVVAGRPARLEPAGEIGDG